ncbi:SDR family NAD(P)-dependent oxidoreductase [Aliishimia ponticola]|uniref:SDR family NAD(P)-dependent oxidoreductase n=1 Tax=Aliishimia ponticola TaxID=2499833 RepID=A0A4V3XKF6_9RHOB|nr:SDR family NAD(P)-dependent oxidoreductase [Aliishimia ponticola]THH36773.1 SDR family NAD(P)-dependent oxidoreductase [Aliishimia ponticola]
MTAWIGKTYWLVGASEGLGEALAHVISRAGAEVIVSARDGDKLAEVVSSVPGHARAVTMDISDMESVKAAAADVGEVDGIVLLAGVYWPMSAKEWDAEKAVQMADVNFTGFLRVLGQVVPGMVEKDAGHIVITSSISGYRGLAGSIGYTASKAATMSLAECMYADLRDTGVKVQVANPGFIRTRLTDKNDFKMPAIMEPEAAAREMFELMNSDARKKSFPALFSLLFRGAQFLPDWLYYRIFS